MLTGKPGAVRHDEILRAWGWVSYRRRRRGTAVVNGCVGGSLYTVRTVL